MFRTEPARDRDVSGLSSEFRKSLFDELGKWEFQRTEEIGKVASLSLAAAKDNTLFRHLIEGVSCSGGRRYLGDRGEREETTFQRPPLLFNCLSGRFLRGQGEGA